MLEFIRRHSQSIVAKVLLIILVLTFVLFFGIIDVIRRFIGKDYVVKVGNVKISPLELKIEKARRVGMLRELQNVNDKDLTASILHQLIWENIVNQAVDEYGILVSDETIKNYIRGMNIFRNKDGSFNAHLLRSFLQRIHIPEAMFLESVKKDIKNTLIKFPFTYISTTPEFDLYMRVRQEKRSLIFVKLKPSSFKITEKPTQKMLEEFYKNNPDLFTAEETRSFRILELKESFWEKSIQISEDEIKEAYDRSTENDERPYEEMKAELESTLKQEKIQSAINEVTRQIEDALMAGDDMNDVVKKYNLNVISVEDMNAVGKDAKSTVTKLSYKDDVRIVAFSVDEGSDSSFSEAEDAQKNKIYWLLHMNKITPKHIVAYKESTAKILSKWQAWRRREKAMEIAADLIAKAKEGSCLDKLATASGLVAHATIAFDRFWQLPKEKVPQYTNIITAVHEDAFELEKTEANYKEISGNIVVYQIKDITSSTETDPKDENACRLELQNEIADDMYQQLVNYLSRKYDVKINTEQLQEIDENSNQNSLEETF
ncbi:MAG: SurA N-terminal domain-containing protein [Holosporaceae bacterium]|jgi:peptidyl-prolyl cis-trans isomerase D|nr:SurA N-terminal domain-containing protein [Holosporaceae bacterium]